MIKDILNELIHMLPETAYDVAIAILPVVVVFTIYQIVLLRLPKSKLIPMYSGMVYAYIGLVFFFLGLEIGFSETGTYLGENMAALPYNWILVPLGLLIGFAVVLAEPAVASLARQVETVSGGVIRQATIYASLCIGVALSVVLAMARALWAINLWYIIIPGYAIALILAKFSPPIFTAIAFDSGGVASGPMTATFVLSFTVGVTSVANPAASIGDSFGVVALVAMTPLITIQILGLIFQRKARLSESAESMEAEDELSSLLDDDDGQDLKEDIVNV